MTEAVDMYASTRYNPDNYSAKQLGLDIMRLIADVERAERKSGYTGDWGGFELINQVDEDLELRYTGEPTKVKYGVLALTVRGVKMENGA